MPNLILIVLSSLERSGTHATKSTRAARDPVPVLGLPPTYGTDSDSDVSKHERASWTRAVVCCTAITHRSSRLDLLRRPVNWGV
ncbi:hypothetical protein BD413DRAFT_196375 [Trametes elegans]|nr:hypothetical protein BD413DRAFT_196375 [Trametes elegans]